MKKPPEMSRLKKYEQNIDLMNERKRNEKLQNSLVYGVVRSKAKWTDEGEERTCYFLNLENKLYTNKIIPKLLIEEEDLIEIRNQKGILNEIESIYKNLYNKNNETID